MDLGATAQKDELMEVAIRNGIHIDRLRGYRLMEHETPMTPAEIRKYNRWVYRYYKTTDSSIIEGGHIHFADKRQKRSMARRASRRVYRDAELWNKYCGQKGVLYIHARLGKGYEDYQKMDWYLDGCLEGFDPTYCSIYAKVDQ